MTKTKVNLDVAATAPKGRHHRSVSSVLRIRTGIAWPRSLGGGIQIPDAIEGGYAVREVLMSEHADGHEQ